jgi:hypothetical protein
MQGTPHSQTGKITSVASLLDKINELVSAFLTLFPVFHVGENRGSERQTSSGKRVMGRQQKKETSKTEKKKRQREAMAVLTEKNRQE